jgi:hypothetical protein
MPSSINGCGTKYYGQRDFRADGSHITTNFFCLLFLPLIPIHSVRLIPHPKNSLLPFSKNYYQVLEKRWPNPVQVLFVYLCATVVVGQSILFFVYVQPYLKTQAPWLAYDWTEFILFCVTLIPLLLASRWLRSQAKERALPHRIDPNDPTPLG